MTVAVIINSSIQALQSMRGVSTIVAATTVAEVGDLKRFHTPSELTAYLGLVPSEHSTGPKIKRGPITKRACTSCLDRGSPGLPASGTDKSGVAQAAGRASGIRLRHCMESPT